MRFVWGFAVVGLLAAGCNQDKKDMGTVKPLPPDHVQAGCMQASDCDDNDPCTTDLCRADHTCSSSPMDCSAMDGDCNMGTCDPKAGCVPMPSNEGADCVDDLFDPGTCASGVCQPQAQCQVAFDPLDCFSSSNTALDSTSGSTDVIDTYACATDETGPELAYQFSVPSDRKVTLKLTDTTADLDLIVLEGDACIGSATCVTKALTRGVTDETVTFDASASDTYLIVVDGYKGAKSSFTLTVGCDNCKTIKDLDCNMTITGNTSGTAASTFLSGFDCDPSTPGPEDTYHLKPPVQTDYTMKLTGLSQDLDLVVVWNTDGACDPSTCKASEIMSGTTSETVSFTGYDFSDYSVIIDSKGAGGPYQLEVSCTPSCYSENNEFTCSTGSDSRRSDDPVLSSNLVNSWPCAPGTSGREVIYSFNPTKAGDYVFELSGLLADLDLIVVEGTSSSCDPTAACVAQGINPDLDNETVTIPAKSGHHYYIVVDSKGAPSPYTLKLKSSPCAPWSCSNAQTELDCTWLEDRGRNDDPTKSRNVVDFWGSCDTSTNGPEVAYLFKAPKDGTYTVTVDGLDSNLDLIVVDGATTAPLCDPTASCQAARRLVTVSGEDGGTGADGGITNAATSESLTFAGSKDKTYWVIVDGRDHATGSYHIALSSPDCPHPICQDALDDLSCDFRRVTGNNNDNGATSDVSAWGSCDTGTSGPERAHLFTPTGAGPYKIKLTGQTADLDLIVMTAGASDSCDPGGTCVVASANGTTDDESVTFTADPTKKYWIVVDGKNGAISPYTLTLTNGCP